MPNIIGNTTKTLFIVTESHKLGVAFKAAAAIKAAQPVKLNGDGDIIPFVAADSAHLCIGYAIKDAAIGVDVTVTTKGFQVITAQAKESLVAGPVKYDAYDAATGLHSFTQVTVLAAEANGWSLTKQTSIKGEIEVLLF